MLSPRNRLTSPEHFREVVRRGRRCGGPLLVVHLRVSPGSPETEPGTDSPADSPADPRVGFVVSKAVGHAVTRNTVKRRLRHLARERTGRLPSRGMLVVRALPAAATATFDELGEELDRCLEKLSRPAGRARSLPTAPAGADR